MFSKCILHAFILHDVQSFYIHSNGMVSTSGGTGGVAATHALGTVEDYSRAGLPAAPGCWRAWLGLIERNIPVR